jgi:uncharacterized protein YgbK (DUF1537 family)
MTSASVGTLLNALPPERTEDVRPAIRRQLADDRRKIIVLDDDPTGTQTLYNVPLGQDFAGWLIIPFFLEGDRYTIDDAHYVAQDDRLVPTGQTEFARDAAFGYRASDLRAWVEEKTGGQVPASQVASISINDLRQGGPEGVAGHLMALPIHTHR